MPPVTSRMHFRRISDCIRVYTQGAKCAPCVHPCVHPRYHIQMTPHKTKKSRGDRIRTCDIQLPKLALYQAELRPVMKSIKNRDIRVKK